MGSYERAYVTEYSNRRTAMAVDLGTILIERIIVHEIPQRLVGGGGAPILSEVESPLNPGLKNFFRERMTRSLGSAAFDVRFDPSTTSPVPGHVADDLGPRRGSFVNVSRAIAQHLFDSQTGVNPAGLLVVIRGTVQGGRMCALLKLEKETGARAHQTNIDGRRTFRLDHLRDLMLTEKTKVFKAGLFVPDDPDAGLNAVTAERVAGMVSDNQRGFHPTTAVADFFLKRFLGCLLSEAPSLATQKFFQAAEAFINEVVTDPPTKARYHVALLATMADQQTTIRPRVFADTHLASSDRQGFIAFLENRGVSQAVFDKDPTLIQSHLQRTAVDFESGVIVTAKPEVFEERITLTDAGEGRTRLEVVDRIKQVRGK